MEIRKVNANDLDKVIKIWRYNASEKGGRVFGIPFTNEITQSINDNRFYCIVENDNIIGIAQYKIMKRNPTIRISNLYVNELFRKKGYATALIKTLLDNCNVDLPIEVHCKDGAYNNGFYERLKQRDYTTYTTKSGMKIRVYILSKEKIYGDKL